MNTCNLQRVRRRSRRHNLQPAVGSTMRTLSCGIDWISLFGRSTWKSSVVFLGADKFGIAITAVFRLLKLTITCSSFRTAETRLLVFSVSASCLHNHPESWPASAGANTFLCSSGVHVLAAVKVYGGYAEYYAVVQLVWNKANRSFQNTCELRSRNVPAVWQPNCWLTVDLLYYLGFKKPRIIEDH